MSFAARLVHDLAIVTPTHEASGDVDVYGQPIAGEPDVDLVAGLIQPRVTRGRGGEVPFVSQAGPEVADYVVFLERRDLSNAAYIRFHPDDGDRYEIIGIRDYNFGRSPHLEVDCRKVRSEALVTS